MPERDWNILAFPKFTSDQMVSLAGCPLTRFVRIRDGERLFSVGECECDFFVIKSGRVDILDESDDPPRVVHTHGPGEFTGEVAQLTCSPALVTAVARGDAGVEAFAVSDAALRQLINHHPEVGDVILQAFLARRHQLESGGFTGIRVVGAGHSKETFRLREFLAKNRVPHTWRDPESDPASRELLRRLEVRDAELPAVVWGRRIVLRNPSERELAEALGLRRPPDPRQTYDLVIVGAGPAGLAAAVYAASEGLETVVLERVAPGGQIGRSMRIDNYPGFPVGITGGDLAERAAVQAEKFGARIPVASPVAGLSSQDGQHVVTLDDGSPVHARCVLVATGADYRMLDVPGCPEFEGRGVYYAATPVEAQTCRSAEAVVVGGGNSAGQAAVFLSRQASKVYLVVRGDKLGEGMSAYLADRIRQTPNIEVMPNTEVARISGDDEQVSQVEVVNNKTGERRVIETPALFSFIGATPRSDWLPDTIERDEKQFVRTGPDLAQSGRWREPRPPCVLETSQPGVFAAGDVRSGSTKRVASAIGEGAMAITCVHRYRKLIRPTGDQPVQRQSQNA
jgi:thioredoxin reductase (NADPH)